MFFAESQDCALCLYDSQPHGVTSTTAICDKACLTLTAVGSIIYQRTQDVSCERAVLD